MRAPCTFRQTDITRALRAMKAAGVQTARIEIDRDGKIVIIAAAQGEDPEPPASEVNEWDT